MSRIDTTYRQVTITMTNAPLLFMQRYINIHNYTKEEVGKSLYYNLRKQGLSQYDAAKQAVYHLERLMGK